MTNSQQLEIFFLKLKISFKSVLKVFLNPGYILTAFIGTILMSGLILWASNLELIFNIFFKQSVGLWEKITFFTSAYQGLFTVFGNSQAISIILVSILFGINIALLIFVIKNRGFKEVPKKSGTLGFILAIVAGGCAACGTSIVSSILISLGATSGPLFRDVILIFNWFASALIIYSIYKLGAICSYIFSTKKN